MDENESGKILNEYQEKANSGEIGAAEGGAKDKPNYAEASDEMPWIPKRQGENAPIKLEGNHKQSKNPIKKLSNHRQVKKLKKDIKKQNKKNPYLKQHVLPNRVRYMAKDNERIDLGQQRVLEQQHKKSQIRQRAQRAQSLPEVQHHHKEMTEATKEQDKTVRSIKMDMLMEDLKNALSGPKGWIKNAKGCFSISCVCGLFFGGGAVVGILALCGVI